MGHKALQQQLQENGFEILLIQQAYKQAYFDHPKSVLQHLKATGVTATAQSHRWTKQSLQQFYSDYQQFHDEPGPDRRAGAGRDTGVTAGHSSL